MTPDQAKQLILSDFVKTNGFAPTTEAANWNNRIPFAAFPPEGVGVYGTPNFQNVWIKALPASPSVQDLTQNKRFTGPSGSVQTAYEFSYVVPRQTFSKDCKTEYEVCGYNSQLDVYRNGQKINGGSSSVGYFSNPNQAHNAAGSVSASLALNGQYLVHHYQMVTRCWQIWSSYYCSTACDYVSTDDKRDQLTIWDGYGTYNYAPQYQAQVFIDNFQNGLLDGWFQINATDYSSIEARFGDSFLRIRTGDYSLKHSLPPYNILTASFSPRFSPIQTNKLSVLSAENSTTAWKIHFLAQTDSLDCSVEVNGHFQNKEFTDLCQFNQSQKPGLNLTLSEVQNGSFQAAIAFSDKSTGQSFARKNVSFIYGNKLQTAITDSSGLASANFSYLPGVSIVSAKFSTDFETRSASATAVLKNPAPDLLDLFWKVVILAFAAYLALSWLRGRYP